MSKIEKFQNFKANEGISSFGAKMRRKITGQSAGEEIDKLSESQQQKLLELYKKDPTEAAKYLRSIIIREKNSQFGLGLALTIAGAAMIYKAAHVEPPPPPPQPKDGNWVDFNPKEGPTQFMNRQFDLKLGPKSELHDFTDAIANKLGGGNYEEGCNNFVAGLKAGGEKETVLKNLLSLKSMDSTAPLKDVFSGDLAPHGGLAWGDLGGKVFVPN